MDRDRSVKLGTARIIQGNALNLPLPDNSVDACITSPPYFSLRSYQDGGQHYDGQIGSEATPAEFLDALLAATREMVRVLKPSGSIFVNLGDKYSGAQQQTSGRQSSESSSDFWKRTNPKNTGIPAKSLMGIPWRYAINCIDQLGLILRAEIIWNKPNGLPESVTDRVRRSHEQWFHMTLQPKYFAAVDEIREPHTWDREVDPKWAAAREATATKRGNGHRNGVSGGFTNPANPLGKLPGSVWTIPTQPLTVPPELGIDHFAAYPMEWPRRIIQGWTPNGVCTVCGQGRRPLSEGEYRQDRPSGGTTSRIDRGNKVPDGGHGRWGTFGTNLRREVIITGYVCGCPDATAPTTPAVVLDPFAGTGTTALVAKALGRIGISIDLSSDYCRLAKWRCNDPRELAAALQVEKPEPIDPDQLSLFENV